MHRYYIYVPKTVEDMKEDYFGCENTSCYEWILSKDEFSILWNCGIFEYLNKKFHTIIDEFEEEWIMYQHLYFYYEELVEELNSSGCNDEIKKLTEMIDKAIECRTLIGFIL